MRGAGDAATKLMAPEQSFTTSPPVGAASQLRFLAWADSGQATSDGTNEYDYSEVGAGLQTYVLLQAPYPITEALDPWLPNHQLQCTQIASWVGWCVLLDQLFVFLQG